MRFSLSTAAALLAGAATLVEGTVLKIHNWGPDTHVMWLGEQKTMIPGRGAITTVPLAPVANQVYKIAKSEAGNPRYTKQVMQFEWTVNDKIWYDLSLIDGNPFGAGNFKVTPAGAGASLPGFDCVTVKCKANEHCKGAYQPEDPIDVRNKSHSCSPGLEILWLDLWEPSANFKRSAAFLG